MAMTKQEFMRDISEIHKRWPDVMTKDFLKTLYGYANDAHPKSWKTTIEFVTNNFQFPPQLPWFKERLKKRQSPVPHPVGLCGICQDLGWTTYDDKDGRPYARPCQCSKGKSLCRKLN